MENLLAFTALCGAILLVLGLLGYLLRRTPAPGDSGELDRTDRNLLRIIAVGQLEALGHALEREGPENLVEHRRRLERLELLGLIARMDAAGRSWMLTTMGRFAVRPTPRPGGVAR